MRTIGIALLATAALLYLAVWVDVVRAEIRRRGGVSWTDAAERRTGRAA